MVSPEPIDPGPRSWATRAQVRRVGTVFLRQRPLYVAPAVLASWVVAVAVAPPLQRAVVMVLSGSLLAFFVVESWLARRRAMAPSWLWRSLVITALGLGGACVATGGLASPYVPLLLAPTVTAFAAFGRGRASAAMLGLLAGIALSLALLPAGWPLPALPGPQRALMLGVTTVLAAALLRVSVAGLSDAHEHAGATLERVRTELLAGATERAAALESMGAQVAHEIRNPLTAIRGLVELLAGGAADERARRRFEVVRGEVERIEGIVRDYLAFARPLSQLRPATISLTALAHDVVEILGGRADAAGVALSVRGPELVGVADRSRMIEALLNLCGNAIEACNPGGQVALALAAEPGWAILTVRDDGRGMAPELLARVGTPGVSGRPGGTGLGVVLARQAIAQHGGSLSFDSGPTGTIATVRLPCPEPA